MKKKSWLPVLAASTVASAVVFDFAMSNRELAAQVEPRGSLAAEGSTLIPEHIVYDFLFRNVTRNNERNLELRATGAVSKKYFAFKRELGFTAEQSRLVTEIATDCEFRIRQQDKSAQLIIAEFRSKLPKTKEAPRPPPELKAMWDERNAMILAARDRLRIALGSETFETLDNFAKYRYGTNKAPVTLRRIGVGQNSEQ